MPTKPNRKADRRATGVVVHVETKPSGAARLVMDDVRKEGDGWTRPTLFTELELDASAFRTMDVDPKQARAIGEALLVRLAALDSVSRAAETRRRYLGRTVVFDETPWWTRTLPRESRRVIESCRGRPYRVAEVDGQGMLVLDVSADVDSRSSGRFNDIRIEPDLVRVVGSRKRSGKRRRDGERKR